MEYQKVTNLLNDASNKPSKFRTRNWVEINDDIRGSYSPNKQIRFETAMLRSSLCDYSDAYILIYILCILHYALTYIYIYYPYIPNNTNKKVIVLHLLTA